MAERQQVAFKGTLGWCATCVRQSLVMVTDLKEDGQQRVAKGDLHCARSLSALPRKLSSRSTSICALQII